MPVLETEIYPVQIEQGRVTGGIPAGVLAAPAPHRCARGRSGETVFLAMAPAQDAVLPDDQLERLAALTARAYFDTPGSVTAALRAAFAALNAEMLPFSAMPAHLGGAPQQLHAVCAVLRERDLYFGYAGATLAAVLRDGGVDLFPAPGDPSSRGLGLSTQVDLRYGHGSLDASATLVLAARPASVWFSIPAQIARLSLQGIAERMAQQAVSNRPPDAAAQDAALLIHFAPAAPGAKPAADIRRAPARPATAPALAVGPLPPKRTPGPEVDAPQAESAPPPAASSTPIPPPEEPIIGAAPEPHRARRVPPPEDVTPFDETEPRLSVPEGLRAFGRSIGASAQAAVSAVRHAAAGLLPRGVLQREDALTLPPNLMLATAIAIPLVVVAVVALLYFQKGREVEFGRLMEAARVQASVAAAATDPVAAKDAWRTTLQFLEEAAKYGSSGELLSMRNQAARTIDSFDGIVPLEFKSALPGGLEEGTRITALLAGDRELFALDASGGRVIRLVLGQGGYQMDASFYCQAGLYPQINVGSPVDIAWVPDLTVGSQQPVSARSGSVVALDSNGVLLYCPVGGQSMAGRLKDPRSGWGAPVAVEYYNSRLYILDPGKNSLWRYDYILSERHFGGAASDYLSPEQDHAMLSDAVDFAVASGEVFILHADGQVTHCEYDPLYTGEDGALQGATLCKNLEFRGVPPDRADGPRVASAMLARMSYNPPPEPTLFFLDSFGRGAYRFSLALNFYARYRVTVAPENLEATAMAVSSDKTIFLAVGNQIYFAAVRNP